MGFRETEYVQVGASERLKSNSTRRAGWSEAYDHTPFTKYLTTRPAVILSADNPARTKRSLRITPRPKCLPQRSVADNRGHPSCCPKTLKVLRNDMPRLPTSPMRSRAIGWFGLRDVEGRFSNAAPTTPASDMSACNRMFASIPRIRIARRAPARSKALLIRRMVSSMRSKDRFTELGRGAVAKYCRRECGPRTENSNSSIKGRPSPPMLCRMFAPSSMEKNRTGAAPNRSR